MYKYEIEYIKRMTDILLNTKAGYNDMVSKNSNTIYMEFLSDLYSCFPYDTFDWTSLSEKKKINALKAFGADMSLLPICIIDNTIMHCARGGAVFAHDTIHFKWNCQYVYSHKIHILTIPILMCEFPHHFPTVHKKPLRNGVEFSRKIKTKSVVMNSQQSPKNSINKRVWRCSKPLFYLNRSISSKDLLNLCRVLLAHYL